MNFVIHYSRKVVYSSLKLYSVNMSRFAVVDEQAIQDIIADKNSKNTKKATNVAWTIFADYMKEKNINIDLDIVTKVYLNELLRKFYCEVRKQDGNTYSMQTLKCVRCFSSSESE